MFHSNQFIRYIGAAFIWLAFYRIIGLSTINQKFLLAITISGFFFILFDFLEFKSGTAKSNFWKITFRYLSNMSMKISALSIILFPFLTYSVEDNKDFIDKINDFTVLCGLGLVVILIGSKSEKRIDESFERVQNVADDAINLAQRSGEFVEAKLVSLEEKISESNQKDSPPIKELNTPKDKGGNKDAP